MYPEINDELKKDLLNYARHVIKARLESEPSPEFKNMLPILKERIACFVTIRLNGCLRGNSGTISPSNAPLINNIEGYALRAALSDPSYSPISPAELELIKIEISLLGEITEVTNIEKIEMGKVGLIAKKGLHQGLLLPQIAQEHNWTRQEYLSNVCAKAGLPEDAWKHGIEAVELYQFPTERFSE